MGSRHVRKGLAPDKSRTRIALLKGKRTAAFRLTCCADLRHGIVVMADVCGNMAMNDDYHGRYRA